MCFSGESVSQKAMVGMLAYAASAMAYLSNASIADLSAALGVTVTGVTGVAMARSANDADVRRCPTRTQAEKHARTHAHRRHSSNSRHRVTACAVADGFEVRADTHANVDLRELEEGVRRAETDVTRGDQLDARADARAVHTCDHGLSAPLYGRE